MDYNEFVSGEKMANKFFKTWRVNVGDKVVSISSIDRFPDFLLKQTITGTVEAMNQSGGLMVKADNHILELDEWDNYLIYDNDGDNDGFEGAFKQEFKRIK